MRLALLVIFVVATAQACAERLLYLGLTDTGWQVFNYDLKTKQSFQLTKSAGDKRRPIASADGKLILCRDSAGDAIRIEATASEKPLFSNWGACGHFSILPDSSTLVFTRLATDNRQRQFIWQQPLAEDKAKLVYRPDRGAISHVAVSPDGKWVAGTHIWRLNEERLVIYPLGQPGSARYLTPEFSVVSYPCWSADSTRIYFSLRRDNSNHDLFVVEVGSEKMKAVLETRGRSEFCPTVDAQERWLYYEERRGEQCGLARTQLNAPLPEAITLPHEAREPFWVP